MQRFTSSALLFSVVLIGCDFGSDDRTATSAVGVDSGTTVTSQYASESHNKAPVTKKALGQACSANAECSSANCVDGVCCNTSCGGGVLDCQACSVAAGASVDGTCAARASGASCRASAGVCDVPEVCDGTSTSCPADVVAAAGTTCRLSAGGCDVAEVCDGQHGFCPGNAVLPAGIPCRNAAGPCDATELCDGASFACPADAKLPAGTVCAEISDLCDLTDICTGTSNACPRRVAFDGTPCDDGLGCTVNSACLYGHCVPNTTLDCSDTNRCTTDGCMEPSGCFHNAVPNCIP